MDKPFDRSMKALSDLDPPTLMKLTDEWPSAKIVRVPRLNLEHSPPVMQADWLYLIETEAGAEIFHCEVNTYYRGNIGEHLTESAMSLHLQYHKPVRSIVILLKERSPGFSDPGYYAFQMGELWVRHAYHVKRLWEIDAEKVLKLGRPE